MYAHPLNTQSAIHELHSDSRENRNEAYASVGGLDVQVQQVRDLLEIPLTRPELFRHYGKYYCLLFFLLHFCPAVCRGCDPSAGLCHVLLFGSCVI
jgi:SpoVK/Ycf46/Vps4 family AAA+-type ATPase